MSKYAGQRSRKTGMPPGSLIHIGNRSTGKVSISVIEYDENSIRHIDVDDPGDLAYFRDSDKISWVNIDGLHNTELVGAVGEVFGLHPLVLEDMLDTEQRPKTEDYGEYIYIAVKKMYTDAAKGTILSDQQSIVLGKGFVITAGENKSQLFEPVRERLENGGRIRKLDADYLAFSLLDIIIDNYYDVLEQQGDRIEEIEDILVVKPVPDTLKKINVIKNDMLFVHRNIRPLREMTNQLEHGGSELIQENTQFYIRSLYDHVVQAMDTIEIYREILSGLLDIYLSSLSNKMNEIMKVLTIISTLFIPLTFLSGIYGMNFRYMPELAWKWGYFVLLGTMAAIAAAMLIFFKKKKWM